MTRRRRWTWRRRCRKWCILMSTLSPTPLLVSTWSLATLDLRCPTPRAGDGDERGGAGNGGAAAWPTRRHYPYTPGTPDLLRGSVGGVSGGSMAPTCDMGGPGGRTLASGVVIAALPPPWLELDHDELEIKRKSGRRGGRQVRERRLRKMAATSGVDTLPPATASCAVEPSSLPSSLVNIGDQVEFTTARVADERVTAVTQGAEEDAERTELVRVGEIWVGMVVVLPSPRTAPPPPCEGCSLPKTRFYRRRYLPEFLPPIVLRQRCLSGGPCLLY
jgi:hypothetical protein